MPITMHDTKPVGLCVATQELFDKKRFLLNSCDGLILRGDDTRLRNMLTTTKRELNAFRTQRKFFDGYKAVITSNIDKILGLVESRYSNFAPNEVDQITKNGKSIIERLLKTDNFDDILKMEADFKSKITLPTYQLFINSLKRSKIKVI